MDTGTGAEGVPWGASGVDLGCRGAQCASVGSLFVSPVPVRTANGRPCGPDCHSAYCCIPEPGAERRAQWSRPTAGREGTSPTGGPGNRCPYRGSYQPPKREHFRDARAACNRRRFCTPRQTKRPSVGRDHRARRLQVPAFWGRLSTGRSGRRVLQRTTVHFGAIPPSRLRRATCFYTREALGLPLREGDEDMGYWDSSCLARAFMASTIWHWKRGIPCGEPVSVIATAAHG